ncbi:MAG: carbohydrate binding domain-containing protein [Clostridia bacterium]|nr:carbohydrate binding domain-containing protein [Clostridia bacterium]
MKRIIGLVLSLICLMTGSASADFNLLIDDVKIELAKSPFMINDTVMLPLREVMEHFFYDVHWNGISKTVEMLRENDTASVKLDSDILTVNDKVYIMPQKTVSVGGTTYFPFYAVRQLVRAEAEWNYDSAVLKFALNERYKNAFNFDANAAGEVVKIVSLIPNSDFEEGSEPWSARYIDTTLTAEKDTVHSGDGAIAFTGVAGKASGIQVNVKDILMEEGDGTYILSFWAKTGGGTVVMSAYPAKINEQNNVPYRDVTVGSEWQKYEVKANLTWGDLTSAPMIFFIDTGKHNGETVYIDDLLFVKE